MRNKKADLMDNVLTTVVAVIGLVLIFYAAYRLYSVYASQEETNAQSLINSLEGKINAVSTDDPPAKVVLGGFSSEKDYGWSLRGWSKEDTGRPDKCFFKSCICICPGIYNFYEDGTTFTTPDYDQKKICQEKGFCRLFNEEKVVVGTYRPEVKLSGGRAYTAPSETPTGNYFLDNTIRIPSNLIEVDVDKIDSSLSVTTYKT